MKLTELYIKVDDFIKALMETEIWEQLYSDWKGMRGPKRKLSISEIVTLNIFRYVLRLSDLKSFHCLIKQRYSREFPDFPNYENFLKATNKSTGFIMVYLQYLLYCNRVMNKSENHYGDSTPLPVCHNYNIYRHKVHKGFADRRKSTKGWSYGFKLHGICNSNGELEKLCFSSGNVYDNQIIEDLLVDDITGSVTFDAGYLLKEEILKKVFTSKRKVYIATRKNMKRLMTGEQMRQFRARSKIETLWGILKEVGSSVKNSNFGLIYFRSRE